jgi:hypothetical protein
MDCAWQARLRSELRRGKRAIFPVQVRFMVSGLTVLLGGLEAKVGFKGRI